MSTLIECTSLSKNYGSTRALDNVSLSLNAGAPIALIGPNGAGKTTLLSLICGYLRPSDGTVRVLGEKAGSSRALTQISALPQDANLDPNFSVELQLQHYAKLRGVKNAKHEAHRVLDLVQLSDRGKSSPTTLSHGMRKRVMLAQSLIGTPKLILLDEPTAGIDPPNVKIIRELITNEAAKATFIVSSHNLDELEKFCTTVVHLTDGKLKGVSNIEEASDDGVISIMLRAASDTIADKIKTISGVHQAQLRGQSELLVEYDQEHHPHVDIEILTLLADNGIRYRRLSKGRSLEEQLFATHQAT